MINPLFIVKIILNLCHYFQVFWNILWTIELFISTNFVLYECWLLIEKDRPWSSFFLGWSVIINTQCKYGFPVNKKRSKSIFVSRYFRQYGNTEIRNIVQVLSVISTSSVEVLWIFPVVTILSNSHVMETLRCWREYF